ncbi:uncharacterized protein LOC105847986 isoform X2 [Hydra vulgaris]|uniref:Uncharacterized protein LOC105847986 isoform X2 n=1 Tax=Hydra vulgaris TaxID=6087 RepID=A0ABM4CMU2_HYDVU
METKWKDLKVNLHYMYSKDNIDCYVNNIIKYKLGGFKRNEHGSEYKFLLNNKFGVGTNSYYVLYSGAIDIANKLPLNFLFEKSKQPANEKEDDCKDVFDEIIPIMFSKTNCKVKILFSYNDTGIHWVIGEIVLDKNNDNVSAVIYTHDPYGGGKISKKHFSILDVCLKKTLKNSGWQVTSVTSLPSPFTNARQTIADKTSCGIIVAHELVKRIINNSLTISSPFPQGAEQLRLSQLIFLKEHLGEDNPNYQLFKQQVSLVETCFEDNLSTTHLQCIARPTIEERLTIEELREKVNKVVNSEELNNVKVDQLKQLLKEQYKLFIHQLAYKNSLEELKDLVIVLNDLGYFTIKLGELSGELEYYNEAAVFYQYVITILDERLNKKLISKENKNEFIKQEKINPHQQLTHIQLLIFLRIGGNLERTPVIQDEVQTNKHMLLALRNKVDKVIQKIEDYYQQKKTNFQNEIENYQELYVSTAKALFEDIANEMKRFLFKLYSDSEQQISVEAPCKYSVVGLGSMALKQMTPYSDLEFAILTENEDWKKSGDPKVKAYFENLSHLVNFKIINLGESIIPKSKYGIDMEHLVHRAVNFDLGGKTPLGRIDKDKPYELIKTVEWMMHYVRNEEDKAIHIDKNLPYILENVCYVYGEKKLFNDYQCKVSDFLHNKIEDKKYGTLRNCEIRAIKLLVEEAKEIDYSKVNLMSTPPISDTKESLKGSDKPKGDLGLLHPKLFDNQGRLFEVKKDIYRLLDRLVYNLGLYYGIEGASNWDTVDKLVKQKFITIEAAVNLKTALTFATTLRLKTYSYHNAQQEDMSIFVRPAETESEIKEQAKRIFHLTKKHLIEGGGLFQYFYTALPLYEKLEVFCSKHKTLNDVEKKTFFLDNVFYENDFATKGFIYYRLAQYDKAQNNLEKALNNLNDNLKVRVILGHIYNSFGNADQAIEQYEYCLVKQTSVNQDQLNPDVAVFLLNLGLSYNAKGQFEQAIKYYNECLEMQKLIYQDEFNPNVADTLNNLGSAFYGKGEFDEAIKYYENSLKMRKLVYQDQTHPSVANSLNNLVVAYRAKGQYDQAIEYFEMIQEFYKLSYREEPHFHVAASLHNLGTVYNCKEQYDEGIACFKKSLETFKIIYKKKPHPKVADSLNSLGSAYHVKGQHDQAIRYFKESLEMQNIIYKKQPNPSIAISFNNLGSAFYAKGQYDEAIKYFNDGLEMRKLIYLDKYHPAVADSLNNLGAAHNAKGEYVQAVKYYETSLEINKFIYKEEPHSNIANCLNNLGNVYNANGQLDQAIKYYKESLEILKLIYKVESHSNVAGLLNNLGILYNAKKQHDQAISYYKESLEMYKLIYDEEPHTNVADSLNNLGNAYNSKGNYDQAFCYYKESLKIYEKIYNAKPHPNIAASLNNLGNIYNAKENFDQAIKHLKRSLNMKKVIYKDQFHPSVADSLNNIGFAYGAKGEYDRAIKCYEESLNIYKFIYKKGYNSNIADSLNNLGNVYYDKIQYDQAISCYKESLEIYKAVYYKEPHLDIVESLNNLGNVFNSQGHYDQAIKYFEESLDMQKQIYKDQSHLSIARSQNNLALVHCAIKQYVQAIKYFEESLQIYKLIYKKDPNLSVADTLNNIGTAFRAIRQYDHAIKYYEESLDIKKLIFKGQPQISVARSLNNLGLAYCDKEQHDQAISYHEESIEIYKLLHKGEIHPNVADSYNFLGNVYNAKGQYDQAIKYHRQAWQIISVFQDHPYANDIKTSLTKTAELYAKKHSLNPQEVINKNISLPK